MNKRLPLGIQDYKEVVSTCFYIDKSELIEKMCDLPTGSTILFTRPRRFGKSLNLSMLQTFFDINEDNRSYFIDKHVFSSKEAMARINSYPCIRLNMKPVVGESIDAMSFKMKEVMAKEYSRHSYLLDSNELSQNDKTYFENVLNQKVSLLELSSSLTKLSDFLFSHFKKKTIILIDEYDSPVNSAYSNSYYDKAIPFFRSLYGDALKGNDSLQYAFLSGVLQIAKESMFSGLNNLIVDSAYNSSYGSSFGFTLDDMRLILKEFGKEDELENLRKWYGGYNFGSGEIFNPWSILSYLNKNRFLLFWANSGENSLIGELVSKSSISPLTSLNRMMENNSVFTDIDVAVNYNELKGNSSSLYSFLLASGFLTIYKEIDPLTYEVGFPNLETKMSFSKEIVDRFFIERTSLDPYGFREAFTSGDSKLLSRMMEDILSSFSYFDFSSEKNYQIFVLTLTSLLFSSCLVKSEVNSGTGRCDILIKDKKSNSFGAVIEIKNIRSKMSRSRLQEEASKALTQIKENDYLELLKEVGTKNIYAYGFAFFKKTVEVSIEKL